VLAAGKRDEAKRRLDALLGAHPFEVDAAVLSASMDLESDSVTPRTLERARRAVRFGGGADALDLLARVHRQRGESEQADQVTARARALREKSGDHLEAPAEGTGSPSSPKG
jgi:hypothetical protein